MGNLLLRIRPASEFGRHAAIEQIHGVVFYARHLHPLRTSELELKVSLASCLAICFGHLLHLNQIANAFAFVLVLAFLVKKSYVAWGQITGITAIGRDNFLRVGLA